MSSAEVLAKRNGVILALREVDKRLTVLFGQKHTNRAYSEALELLDQRLALAYELTVLGGEPGEVPLCAKGWTYPGKADDE